MEERKNKAQIKLLAKVAFCLSLILVLFFVTQKENYQEMRRKAILTPNVAENINTNSNRCYLSDMKYIEGESYAANGHMIKLDKNDSDKLINLQVEGKSKTFIKGICAWASSQIIYDLNGYKYDYFTTYLGVDIEETSDYFNTGVRFKIYTSNDGKTWKTEVETDTMYGWSDAQFIKIDIREAKYLKLVADNNSPNWWAEWYDEAIYADAKLIRDGYEENLNKTYDFIKTLDEYDEIIKGYEGQEITGDYELYLLQRELVKNAGYDILQATIASDESVEETIRWLVSDVDNLRLYILGGEPDGNYVSSLQVLTKLYTKHKEDLENTKLTKHGTVYGELYKKMMITLSLTHSAQVALWMDTTSPENQSDAVTRYEIYKYLHENNKFVVSKNQDHTPWFEDLKVEEMRYVLNNIIDDEEILWLNEYTQEYIDKNPGKEEEYLQPHHYMKYIWPDYSKPEFHDLAKKEEWDKKYHFLKYNVTYRPGVYKLWMNIEGGAVCGGISKIGSNIRGVHGTPSSVISQPGHAALIYYRKDKDNNGYWTIDNDVSGWAQSGKTEKLSVRMPLGWGSDEYVEGWAASYIVLAQEALNHNDEYEEASKVIMTADAYKDNPEKQEEIYRKALDIEPINIDAWYGLIKLYKADSTKTEKDYYDLAVEIGENLKCYPLPMYNLTNQIKPMFKNNDYIFKFTILQANLLEQGSKWEDGTKVYQPSITRTVASFLLGQMDKDLAKFSFDGEDAGKIVLAERFDNSGINWDYSIDGKTSWNIVSFTADEEHKLVLPEDKLSAINAENDIYVHIVGTGYEEENLYKVDITEGKNLDTLYANDLENRVVGVGLETEWRYNDGEEWTSYNDSSPILTGNKSIQIREPAKGAMLASEPITFTFNEDTDTTTRKYVPVSHLSIDKVSTEAGGGHQGEAIHAIDGNYNTRYHSDWSGNDTERYMVIKVDRPIYLSAIEYVPAGGGNGKILDGTIYGSMDGENFDKLISVKGLANNEDIKYFDLETSQEVQYIKIVADKASNGNWFTARMFNVFQDLTKNPHPTAGIAYSTIEPTNEDVVARLVNPSTDIRITNNNGSNTYSFTDNTSFTFEFIDDVTGKTGSAEAKVTWIDRIAPTATIEYSTTTHTNDEVVATLIPSEDVTILNNADTTYTFEKNGSFTFEFQDAAGNKGEATAKVYWIGIPSDAIKPGDPGFEDGPGIEDPIPPIPDDPTPSEPDNPNPPTPPVSEEKVESTIYEIEDEYISKINELTKVSEFKQNIKSNGEVIITDKNGNVLNDEDIITTDTIVKLSGGKEYKLIVIGDIDCDGEITVNDLAKIKLFLIDFIDLTESTKKAANIDTDTEITINDLAIIKLILIGLI